MLFRSVLPHAQVSYAYETSDSKRDMVVTSASGTDFAVSGVAPGRGALGIGLGLDVEAHDNLAFYADYDGQISTNLTLHSFSAGLRYKF